MSTVPSRAVGQRAVAFLRAAGPPTPVSPALVRVFVTQRSFSSEPPSGSDPPADLPSHVTPPVKDFRNQEFKLTGLASKMRQQKQRLIEVKNAQGATAQILQEREAAVLAKEAASKKVKVELVFEVQGFKVNVGEVNISRSDFEKLQKIQNDLNEPSVRACMVDKLCCLGLDRESVVMILKGLFEKKPAGNEGSSSGTGGAASGSGTGGSSSSGTGDASGSGTGGASGKEQGSGGSYEWNFEWLWAVLGKQSGSGLSTVQWGLAVLLRSVDWMQLFWYILALAEAGVLFDWELVWQLLVAMFQVSKESQEKDTKVDEAWARVKVAKAAKAAAEAGPAANMAAEAGPAAEAGFTAKVAAEAGLAAQAATEAVLAAQAAAEAGLAAQEAAEAGLAAQAAAEAGLAAKAAAEADIAAKAAGEAGLAAKVALEACLPARLASEAGHSSRLAARAARVAAAQAGRAARAAADSGAAAALKDSQARDGSNDTA